MKGETMSIILKGIDLDTDYGLCILTKSGELITANGKHIQAIQIPTSHGRIADVGEGEKKMCEECQFKGDCLNDPNVLCTDREIFSLAPTILEAEE